MGSYKSCQDRTVSAGSSSSTESDASYPSRSTALTAVSDRQPASPKDESDWDGMEGPRDSVSTYASTTASAAVAATAPEEQPRYEVYDRRLQETFPTDVLASSPASFAALFPSPRRLLIRHDDATIDGNMNLRVDTVAPCRGGYNQDVILFHLRMYDLFTRKFSFRRYCRDSGREVCHSTRKETSTPNNDRNPCSRRRSWSSMLASIRPGSSGQDSSTASLKHRDASGFGAVQQHDESLDELDSTEKSFGDAILMEFSNYAHVELKRRGAGPAKRYEYEYWSTKYQWRREFRKEGELREVSYHLVDTRTSNTIAHMVPEILTPLEAGEEESKGGWVPPTSLWISDPNVYERMPDIADVIVATGLIVLVDDCIRRRWHHGRRLPARTAFARRMERMGPRRLIGEVLQRRGSA
ncbi:hypothetical protein N7474_010634 [Penicillium riverlandense]|uniref:uncharacterized protein n=1 Tax=Penicillium riverlandense TaxID=1903569 RepID=UPI002546E99E|nr:uncharacterized protein N7474_010634 [Penicillium riverlandense]KAJ5807042.1 hypothetical protein N7474_010634 [Penicillium riverlandense]